TDHQVDRRIQRVFRHGQFVRPHAQVTHVFKAATGQCWAFWCGDALEDRQRDILPCRVVGDRMGLNQGLYKADNDVSIHMQPGRAADDRGEYDVGDEVVDLGDQFVTVVRVHES